MCIAILFIKLMVANIGLQSANQKLPLDSNRLSNCIHLIDSQYYKKISISISVHFNDFQGYNPQPVKSNHTAGIKVFYNYNFLIIFFHCMFIQSFPNKVSKNIFVMVNTIKQAQNKLKINVGKIISDIQKNFSISTIDHLKNVYIYYVWQTKILSILSLLPIPRNIRY